MRFTRDIFQADGSAQELARIRAGLRRGCWLVQAASRPPPAHQPRRLLAGCAGQAGMAISLSTATLLRLDLGSALIERLAAEGCVVAPLADVALHEILVNAAVHGNLAVASGPSTVWSELARRQSEIEAALHDPIRAARLVTVALGWDGDSVAAVVADEGAGYPIRGEKRGGERGAGRGLMIARAAARLDVLCRGRCTRLVFGRRREMVGT